MSSYTSALPPPLPPRYSKTELDIDAPSSSPAPTNEIPLSTAIHETSAFLSSPSSSRLSFPPTYALIGIYRLLSDPHLRNPIWAKTRNGTLRGLAVGAAWIFISWRSQLGFVERFLMGTRMIKKFANNEGGTVILGYNLPLAVYATIFIIGGQFWYILKFFLSKNIKIARKRAWDLTVESRNKPASFWGPYVEEYEVPPVEKAKKASKRVRIQKVVFGKLGRFFVNKFILFPLNFVPVVGIIVSSMVKALGSARFLHEPYFASKGMTPNQALLFVEERKWDYYSFGFAASLLESLPFVGMFFSISNRIGAAMWAFDCEKRQEAFRTGELKPQPRQEVVVVPGVGKIGRVGVRTEMGEKVERFGEKGEEMPGGLD
ncbi:hypothetical protein BDY24DRAFT_413246 [Mrakia frigida]|uniref:Lds2p n=1 Tax=Mrakia frigida TaxID=29902 RepID=UPI003FCC060C